jgi:hypothetical protein
MQTKKPLKTKKAVKRLDRVEALLSKVIGQYAADELGVHELLDSARASVVRAIAKAKLLAKAQPAAKAKARIKAKSGTKAKASLVKKRAPRKAESRTSKTKPAAPEGAMDRKLSNVVAAVSSV